MAGSQTDERTNASIDRLVAWLPKNIPDGDDETVIVHGDFRFDNMMFHQTEPRVIGIFDWELSTLGHPMADLAYVCIRHNMPHGIYDGLMGLDLDALGIPAQDELVAAYKRAPAGGRHHAVPHRLLPVPPRRHPRRRTGAGAGGECLEQSAISMGPVATLLADRAWDIAATHNSLSGGAHEGSVSP